MSRLGKIGKQVSASKYQHVDVAASGDVALETIMADVAVEAVNIDAEGELITSVEGVITSLENIAEVAAATGATGGYGRDGGALLEVAVESQLAIVGMDEGASPVASLEAFGGTATAEEATNVSVENIKEKAKELWAWLVKKYKEAREKVFKWFKSVFSGAAMLKKRAESVAKKANDKNGTLKEDHNSEIAFGGAAKQLFSKSGLKVEIGKLAENVEGLRKAVEFSYRNHKTELDKVISLTTGGIDAVTAMGKEKLEGGEVKDFFDGGKFAGKVEASDVAKMTTPSEHDGSFLGARVFVYEGLEASSVTDMASMKNALDKKSVRFEVEKDSNGKALEFDEDQTFDAKDLNATQAKEIAEAVVVIAEAIAAFEQDYFKFQKSMEDADKSAEKLGKVVDKASLNAPGAAANKVSKALLAYAQRVNSNPVNQLTAGAMGAAKAALDVCEKSLGQYE